MYFEQIIIADINKKTARLQRFNQGLNVITSEENHVGKSSLLKSLYYTLGAEVIYDNVWDKNTKVYIVDFILNDKKYRIARYIKKFAVFEENELILITDSVSKDLAKTLEEIFSFGIYLSNKKKKVELAPPVFSFMPYYIDQDRGWNGLYDSFGSLDQYDTKSRIKSLYYHLGIYTKHTISLMADRDRLKDEIELLKKQEEKIRITIESISAEIQNLIPAESVEELEKNLQIPKEKIANLVDEAGGVRNKIQELETVLEQHKHQMMIIEEYHHLKNNISRQDKKKSINSCPRCGYTFDDELYDIVRSNYNIQNEDYMKQQIQLIIESITAELNGFKERYVALMEKLAVQEHAYDDSQDAYSVYVRQRGLNDSLQHFTSQLGENAIQQSRKEDEIKEIGKQLRKLPNKKETEETYIKYVRENIIKLGAWNVAYEDSIKLLSPIKAQGTLENKIILAQFIGLFQTMEAIKVKSVRFPFIVDSPRAKEASHASSNEIIKMICELDMLPQIILATMNYEDFDSTVTRRAFVTKLDDKQHLLNEATYNDNCKEIEDIFDLLKNC